MSEANSIKTLSPINKIPVNKRFDSRRSYKIELRRSLNYIEVGATCYARDDPSYKTYRLPFAPVDWQEFDVNFITGHV